MNWILFAAKVPTLIAGAMQIVASLRIPGAKKKEAVLVAIPQSVEMVEFAMGKDVINDPVIAKLISAYIDAEAAAMRAKAALTEGILVKSPVIAEVGPPLVPPVTP